ncbi:MAG: alpha/beta fold hydrolase [Phycisphaerales bacterium]|nr:MAG: alpha/beta fold hydrolase [Phycisphaerales bacterium]
MAVNPASWLPLAQTSAHLSGMLDGWMIWCALAGVSLVGLCVYPAMILRKYVRIMINIMEDAGGPCCDAGDAGRLPGDEVQFRAADGHLLWGTIMHGRPEGRRRGMIVFAHEFNSDRTSARRYCRALIEDGYDVFAFDFRGHGASPTEHGYKPRQWPSDREQADVLGAVMFIGDWLERHGRPREIGLYGISRGGGASILAAVGLRCVRAIVTDSAFSSDTTMEYLMKRFATIFATIRVVAENHPPTFWRFLRWLLFRECRRRFNCRYPSVRKAARRLKGVPVFLIHGEKDSYIPVAQSQAIYECVPGPRRLWVVPGAKHNWGILAAPNRYPARLVRFFSEHLSGGVEARPVPPTTAVEVPALAVIGGGHGRAMASTGIRHR